MGALVAKGVTAGGLIRRFRALFDRSVRSGRVAVLQRRLACSIGAALLLFAVAPTAAGADIAVTTNSDAVNGDASSVAALLANPGADGISLREAISATNNDPGSYSIGFAAALAGTTIGVGSDSGQPLPALTGGGVSINGDTNGDGRPDVTLINAVPQPNCFRGLQTGFAIGSSGNRLHALAVRGFVNAVHLEPPVGQSLSSQQTYADNEISDLKVSSCGSAILFATFGNGECIQAPPCQTSNRWLDVRITGNTIESRSAINVDLSLVAGDLLQGLTITGNKVKSVAPHGGPYGSAINVEGGAGAASTGNRIANVVIAHNRITGNPETGIRLNAGGIAGVLEGVRITGNHVDIGPPLIRDLPGSFLRTGIFVASADTEPQNGVYSKGNVTRDIVISDNTLRGGQGVRIGSGCCGSSGNATLNVRIVRNTIRTRGSQDVAAAVWLEAGHGLGPGVQGPPTRRNRMNDLAVVRNRIAIESEENPAGILVTGGGYGRATHNSVTCLHLRPNRITGTRQAVRLLDNFGGSRGNRASLGGC